MSTRTHEGATGSSLLHALSWTHDGRGLPDTLTDDEGAHDYTHDLRGRLTAVDHPTGSALSDESYGYDKAYRRTSAGGVTEDHVSPSNDLLASAGTVTYTHDAEGRRRRRDVSEGVYTTYQWDALSRLVGLRDTVNGAVGIRLRRAGPAGAGAVGAGHHDGRGDVRLRRHRTGPRPWTRAGSSRRSACDSGWNAR